LGAPLIHKDWIMRKDRQKVHLHLYLFLLHNQGLFVLESDNGLSVCNILKEVSWTEKCI
jgi:hypothetical protein